MTSGRFLIGIDIGTTGTKVAVLDVETDRVTTEAAAAGLSSPSAGWAEADPDQWWSNVCELLPRTMSTAGAAARDVAAVAVTGMVPALVLTDADGRPLRRAILQNDARAVDEIDDVGSCLGELDVLAVTGSVVSQQSIAPTLLWLAKHEPGVVEATTRIMGSYDWVATTLGAEPHLEQNWALESGLFGLGGEPVADVLAAARIGPELLPPVVRSGSVAGGVSEAAAAATGLVKGTTIVAGGADHVLAAYAAGLTQPGEWLVKLGGAGDILAVSRTRLVDRRIYLDHHPIPDLWLPNGCMATSGTLVRWLQHLLGDVDLSELDRRAEAASPASVICLPYFLGEKSPLHDPALRGAFLGLHLGHTSADLYRACLEAVAYGMRQHVEIFAELSMQLEEGFVTNGGSKSTLWKQILADVLDRPLTTITESAGASLGAAVVAGIGSGIIDDWYHPRRILKRQSVVEPVPADVARYDEAYQLFRTAQDAVMPISHSLSRSAS